MYKGYPFSKTTYYRRLRRAKALGCRMEDVPDGRGKHGHHARASAHPRWNKSRIVSQEGYVKVRVGRGHPLADPNGYTYEHLLVWTSAGRSIGEGEMLHHANGDKTDNRLGNLKKMTRGEHIGIHVNSRVKEG